MKSKPFVTKLLKLLLSSLLLIPALNSSAQNDVFKGYENLFIPPLSHIVYQVTDSLVIDGKSLETDWQKATWSEYFSDIEGYLKPKPSYQTRFKMLWDSHYVYIYLEMEEPHVWATLKNHDEVIFYDNDIEVFIDPDGDTQNYFEVEVNAFKTIFDLFLPRPYRNYGSAIIPWHVNALKVGVWIDGTINNPNDADKKWCVEMAIPFRSISVGNYTQVPKEGTQWRLNFSRVEWDVELTKDGYQKRIDPTTQKPYAEHNWVWSPQGVIDMHFPERWGYVIFSSSSVGNQTTKPELSILEISKKYLWLLYYKQMKYKMEHAGYAQKLKQLQIKDHYIDVEGQRYKMKMESTNNLFLVSLKNTNTGEIWQINQLGHIAQKQ